MMKEEIIIFQYKCKEKRAAKVTITLEPLLSDQTQNQTQTLFRLAVNNHHHQPLLMIGRT